MQTSSILSSPTLFGFLRAHSFQFPALKWPTPNSATFPQAFPYLGKPEDTHWIYDVKYCEPASFVEKTVPLHFQRGYLWDTFSPDRPSRHVTLTSDPKEHVMLSWGFSSKGRARVYATVRSAVPCVAFLFVQFEPNTPNQASMNASFAVNPGEPRVFGSPWSSYWSRVRVSWVVVTQDISPLAVGVDRSPYDEAMETMVEEDFITEDITPSIMLVPCISATSHGATLISYDTDTTNVNTTSLSSLGFGRHGH